MLKTGQITKISSFCLLPVVVFCFLFLLACQGNEANNPNQNTDIVTDPIIDDFKPVNAEIGTNDFQVSSQGLDGDTLYDADNVSVAYNATDNIYLLAWAGDANEGGFVDGENEIYGQLINGSGQNIGENFRISTQGGIGDGTVDARDPAVAWNSTEGEFLVVWNGEQEQNDDGEYDTEIFGQSLNDETGDPKGSFFRISNVGPEGAIDEKNTAEDPAVAYNSVSNEYLVIWTGDHVDKDNEIWGQRISASGDEVGQDFQISDTGNGSSKYDASKPALTYNPDLNEYLVVWEGQVKYTVVDGNNSPVDTAKTIDIFGQRLNGNGTATGSDDFRISDMGPDTGIDGHQNFEASEPDVAYNSTNKEYLVVWHGDDDAGGGITGDQEIYGQRLSANGTQQGTNDFRISYMGYPGSDSFDANSADVVWNANNKQYLVVWSSDHYQGHLGSGEQEIWGQFLDNSGNPVAGLQRLSQMGEDGRDGFDARNPAIAYNSTDNQYLIAWEGTLTKKQVYVSGDDEDEVEIFAQLFQFNLDDDEDSDGDGYPDSIDNCPNIPGDQLDSDGDGQGNPCDSDDDDDGIADKDDNCTVHDNPDQADSDGDGYGDACDPHYEWRDNCSKDADCSIDGTMGDNVCYMGKCYEKCNSLSQCSDGAGDGIYTCLGGKPLSEEINPDTGSKVKHGYCVTYHEAKVFVDGALQDL
jgi:hypothetical protein